MIDEEGLMNLKSQQQSLRFSTTSAVGLADSDNCNERVEFNRDELLAGVLNKKAYIANNYH